MKTRLTCLLSLMLAACESTPGSTAAEADVTPQVDSDTRDTPPEEDSGEAGDSARPDNGTGGDGADADAGAGGDDSAATNDSGETTDSLDISEDASKCEYLENPVYLICGANGRPGQFLQWDAIGDPTCPSYFTDGDDRHDSVAALAEAAGCEAGCLFRATQAVDFIRCDGAGRSGYETFTSAEPGCEGTTIYRTADGAFTDLCLWPAYLCYCGEP